MIVFFWHLFDILAYLNAHVGDVSLIVMAFWDFTKHLKACGISVHKENSMSALQQAIRRPIRPGPWPRLAGIHQDQPHTQTRVAFSDLQ